jgi:hypothetical protein
MYNHPRSQSALFVVIVLGMYSSLRWVRTASDMPPARVARRVLSSDVGSV